MIGLLFQHLFERSPNAYMVIDRDLRYVAANEAYQRETATRFEDLAGRTVFEVFPNDPTNPNNASALLLRESLERVIETGETDVLASVVYTVPTLTANGAEMRERVWSATHTPIHDEAGRVLYVLQHTVDVTELHALRGQPRDAAGDGVAADVLRRADKVQRANTLIDGERRELRRLFDQSPGFVAFLRGPNHVFELVNPAYYQLVGNREVIGKTVGEALSEISAQGYVDLLDRVYATAEPFSARSMPVSLQREPDAPPEERFVDFVFQPIVDAAGASVGIFVSGNDITTERRAIAERQRLAIEQSFLAEFLPVQVWTSDPEGALTYVSQTAIDYFGASAERIIGEGWKNVVHPDDLANVIARWSHCLATGEAYEVEFRLRRGSDESYRWHMGRARALRGDDGAILKWFGSNTDIDDQRKVLAEREQLIAALRSKNGELDRFAHVASHDLKAPLRGLMNLSDWILEDLSATASAETLKNLSLLGTRAKAMSNLVDGILTYARAARPAYDTTQVDTAELCAEVIALLAPRAGAEVIVAKGLPTLRGSRTALSQVFMNLIGNALSHASPDGVRVRVDALRVEGAYRFTIADDGSGIPASLRPQLWEMFRTARSATSGSGIGLSIVKRTVEAHGGTVDASDTPGGGATFAFTWPDTPQS